MSSWTDFKLLKDAVGPQKSTNFVRCPANFVISAFCAPRAVASMTAACALPRSSDAALAAYERGGVHGIVVALGLQSNSGLRLREQPVSRLTGGRLLAASVGGEGERRGSEGPAVSDLRSEAAASSAQMMDCITECSWPPLIPPSPASTVCLLRSKRGKNQFYLGVTKA